MLKKISTAIIIILVGVGVMATIIALTGCTNKVEQITVEPRFSGDHETKDIRAMWLVCYQSRIRALPYIPRPVHWQHCDCMTDKSREVYSFNEYNKETQEKLTEFYTGLHRECEKEMGIKFSGPNKIDPV